MTEYSIKEGNNEDHLGFDSEAQRPIEMIDGIEDGSGNFEKLSGAFG